MGRLGRPHCRNSRSTTKRGNNDEPDVIAEVIATSFNADRPVRTGIQLPSSLHAPDKTSDAKERRGRRRGRRPE